MSIVKLAYSYHDLKEHIKKHKILYTSMGGAIASIPMLYHPIRLIKRTKLLEKEPMAFAKNKEEAMLNQAIVLEKLKEPNKRVPEYKDYFKDHHL